MCKCSTCSREVWFKTFSQQIVCVHPTNPPEIPHFFGHFPGHQGCFFYGFPHIPGTSTAFLHLCGIFIQNIYPQIICVHSADALELPHFPGTFTQTPCKNAVHVLGRHRKPKKKQPWCPGKCAKKCGSSRASPGCIQRIWWVNVLNKYVTHM